MFLLDFCGNNMAQIGKNENKSIGEHISPYNMYWQYIMHVHILKL